MTLKVIVDIEVRAIVEQPAVEKSREEIRGIPSRIVSPSRQPSKQSLRCLFSPSHRSLPGRATIIFSKKATAYSAKGAAAAHQYGEMLEGWVRRRGQPSRDVGLPVAPASRDLSAGCPLDAARPNGQIPRVLWCRGVAQPGRAPALGAGGRWFESSRPDHLKYKGFLV